MSGDSIALAVLGMLIAGVLVFFSVMVWSDAIKYQSNAPLRYIDKVQSMQQAAPPSPPGLRRSSFGN